MTYEVTAKKFLVLEDNEDGTSTITVNPGTDENLVFVVPVSIENLDAMFPMIDQESIQEIFEENVIAIPNSLE